MQTISREQFIMSLPHVPSRSVSFVHCETSDGRRDDPQAVRGGSAALSKACDCETAKWFSPNLFNISKFGRTKQNLQYIRVLALDFDGCRTMDELLDAIREAGLPLPHYVVQSKTDGHWHVYWLISPTAAYKNVVAHMDRILKVMAEATGADLSSVGVERWFGVPRRGIWALADSNELYTYETFRTWYDINHEAVRSRSNAGATVYRLDVFGHPAIRKLLQGANSGTRDNTCFTLALLYYACGFDKGKAIEELQSWNNRNTPALLQKDIVKCVKSAYSGKYRGPSREHVERLSGLPFKLNVISTRETKRKNQKQCDIEYRIIQLIGKAGSLTLSQKDIAEAVKAPLRTVKKALKELIEAKRITASGGGQGRGNVTTYELVNAEKTPKQPLLWSTAQEAHAYISASLAMSEIAASSERRSYPDTS